MASGKQPKKFVQTTLFGSSVKTSRTVHKNPRNVYEQFINLFVNVNDNLGCDDAVRKAQ